MERYPALRFLISLYKVFAVILAIGMIILTLAAFVTNPIVGIGVGLANFIVFIAVYASGELLDVALSIEGNLQESVNIQRQLLQLQLNATASTENAVSMTNSQKGIQQKVSNTMRQIDLSQEVNAILAQIGDNDTRPPLGLSTDGLPDVDWVDISAGQFLYGNGKEERDIPYDYKMSKYPVTYAQFQAFIDAPDGLKSSNHNWFEGLHKNATKTGLIEQFSKYHNHPREQVNWYQAMAFCRWLSYKLGGSYALEDVASWAVRLPTELEWEKAARGTDGRIYPYGDTFDGRKANTRELAVGTTTVVGIFPSGASPYGVLDMSGNVWEWCLSDYNTPADYPNNENISTSNTRVLRGGSFSYFNINSRAAYRLENSPYSSTNQIGFRVVSSS
jgi:formylglycine-generating enzyme required for sulfatase activity